MVHWTSELIIKNLKQIINKIGHFPSTSELNRMGRNDLVCAINKNGKVSKFRDFFGCDLLHKPKGYWSKENTIKETHDITNKIGHFPSQIELRKMNRDDLLGAMYKYGGISTFRNLLGYNPLHRPDGYWSKETVISEIKSIISVIGHFPTQSDLRGMGMDSLNKFMNIYAGGYVKLRNELGYELSRKPDGYWTDETIISELYPIIERIKHFPTHKELYDMGRSDLTTAIIKCDGVDKFKKIMGYNKPVERQKKWSDETIINEIKILIEKYGYFPSFDDFSEMGKSDLRGAISKNGGINKFRGLLGQDSIYKPEGYWTDETITKELIKICNELHRFPSYYDLESLKKSRLYKLITINGGMNKFRKLLGYDVSIHDKYKSELMSYVGKRGRESEKLVKKILADYCTLHNLPSPLTSVNLSKGNIIEFVCNTDKRIGIDVTNTKIGKCSIRHKWTRKDYHKYLDELWIVVFSDTIKEDDYTKWNNTSPDNVKVMPIHRFLEELDYSLDEYLKIKVNRYCSCTFRNKEQFKKKRNVIKNMQNIEVI